MSTLRVTGLKQETSTATNISLAVGGGVTVAGISTFYSNAIFTNDVTVSGNISVGGTLTYEDVTSVDSIGIITARSGLHVGTGTSISSPSSNVLTLGTNNEERLRITSDGNFGIGTSSVGSLLHVSGTSSTAFDETNFDSADYNFLKIENTTDSKSAGIRFQIGSNGEAAITATEVSDGACDIVFQNRGGGIRSEKMRLDSSGKLLVGTSTALTTAADLNTAKTQVSGNLAVTGITGAFSEIYGLASTAAQVVDFVLDDNACYMMTIFRHSNPSGSVGNAGTYLLSRSGSSVSTATVLAATGIASVTVDGSTYKPEFSPTTSSLRIYHVSLLRLV